MTENDIVTKVREIMNEAGSEESLTLLDEDNIKLDTYIKSTIPDAVNIVAQNSPVRCVNAKSNLTTSVNIDASNGLGQIAIPTDFVSLIAIKMSSWKRIVSQLLTLDSEEYKSQTTGYATTGLNKPMCFLSYSGDNKVIEFFSKGIKKTDTLSTFVYEGRYKSNEGLNLDASDPLAQAVCYMVASLVYAIFENNDASKTMRDIAVSLIPK